MGLSYGPVGAYAGGVTVADPPEGDAEMRRRHLLATAGIALVGEPVKHLGELLQLPGPSPVELPFPARLAPRVEGARGDPAPGGDGERLRLRSGTGQGDCRVGHPAAQCPRR